MTTAYTVQSHAQPAQVARLVRTLKASSPKAVIVVSHSRTGTPLDVEALESFPDVYVLPAQGGYGDWTHVQRWLDVADFLSDRGISYDWLTLLSGQDYPAKPLEEAEAELESSDADAFIEHFPVLSPTESHWPVRLGRSRYFFHHRRLRDLDPRRQEQLRPLQALNFVQPLARIHVSFGLSVGWRARTPYSPEFSCYGGSVWNSMNRDCVEYVRQFCRDRPDVVRHYEQVLAPDESFFHTVLVNARRFRLVNDPKRYFDFSETRFNHPKSLTMADLPAIIASGAHFVRKVDLERNPDIFEALDELVLGGGSA